MRRLRGASEGVVAGAKLLRGELTPAERSLWQALRGRKVSGLRFRCQHAVGPFVLDFFCPAAKLVIEVDGPIHKQQREQDAARTEHLEQHDYRVLRFTNDQVLTDLDTVLSTIVSAAHDLPRQHRVRHKKEEQLGGTNLITP